MACCAFAIFLLGQLYAAVAAIHDWLGFREKAGRDNMAASWRRGDMPVRATGWRWSSTRGVCLLSLAGLLVTTSVFIWPGYAHAGNGEASAAAHAGWCGDVKAK